MKSLLILSCSMMLLGCTGPGEMLPTEGGQAVEAVKEDTGQSKDVDLRVLPAVRVVWNEPGLVPGENLLRYTDGGLYEITDDQIVVVQTHNPQTGENWAPKIINRADIRIAHYMEEAGELEL